MATSLLGKRTLADTRAFTIVELIVIIIVIGILATITIISYRTVTDNANEKSLTSDLQSTASLLNKYKSDKGGFPTSQAAFTTAVTPANTSGQTSYTYTYNATTGRFCLIATGFDLSYVVTSINTKPTSGSVCPS